MVGPTIPPAWQDLPAAKLSTGLSLNIWRQISFTFFFFWTQTWDPLCGSMDPGLFFLVHFLYSALSEDKFPTSMSHSEVTRSVVVSYAYKLWYCAEIRLGKDSAVRERCRGVERQTWVPWVWVLRGDRAMAVTIWLVLCSGPGAATIFVVV